MLQVRVDRQVCCNVPSLNVSVFWHTICDMKKHDVVILVLEHITPFSVRQFLKELWIVKHFKLTGIRIDHDTGSWNSKRCSLVDTSRDGSKERFVHQQASCVNVEVKVRHCSSLCLGVVASQDGHQVVRHGTTINF